MLRPNPPTCAAPLIMNGSGLRLPAPNAPFQLPALQSSFGRAPLLINPHYELVKQHCDAWILDVAQPPSAAACRWLLDCDLPRLICQATPSASSVPRLIHATKVIAWLTIADDKDDHPDALGADDAATAAHASRVLAILHNLKEDDNELPSTNQPMQPGLQVLTQDAVCAAGPNQFINGMPQYAIYSKSEKREAALEALTKLWAEMRREMAPSLRDRFVVTMEDYFHAVGVQATFRKVQQLPDMEAFLEIRRQASFGLPCFVLLAEYALGIDLDNEAYYHPLVEKFRYTALDYTCLCNDLTSCKVEILVGDYCNMPSVVYYNSSANKDYTFQDAINHVAIMIKDLDEQCVSMLSVIQQSSSPSLIQHHPSLNTYLGGLCTSMAGVLAWSLETTRYRISASSVLDL